MYIKAISTLAPTLLVTKKTQAITVKHAFYIPDVLTPAEVNSTLYSSALYSQ